MLKASDLYHTGIVVDDLDASMRRMSDVAGYRWTDVVVAPLRVRAGERDLDVTFRFVYSLDAPHLELVASIPGTVWTPAPGNAAHHLGYFVDDFDRASQWLDRSGFEREACGYAGDAPGIFAYHRDRAGVRIEIVDRSIMGDWAAYLQASTPARAG